MIDHSCFTPWPPKSQAIICPICCQLLVLQSNLNFSAFFVMSASSCDPRRIVSTAYSFFNAFSKAIQRHISWLQSQCKIQDEDLFCRRTCDSLNSSTIILILWHVLLYRQVYQVLVLNWLLQVCLAHNPRFSPHYYCYYYYTSAYVKEQLSLRNNFTSVIACTASSSIRTRRLLSGLHALENAQWLGTDVAVAAMKSFAIICIRGYSAMQILNHIDTSPLFWISFIGARVNRPSSSLTNGFFDSRSSMAFSCVTTTVASSSSNFKKQFWSFVNKSAVSCLLFLREDLCFVTGCILCTYPTFRVVHFDLKMPYVWLKSKIKRHGDSHFTAAYNLIMLV